jgi:hypothetical protein
VAECETCDGYGVVQPDLFGEFAPCECRVTGEVLRDKGTAVALEAVPLWRDQAAAWIAGLPWGVEFTSEDLTAAIGLPRSVGKDRNNAVGASVRAAAQRGLIHRVGYRNATRKESHAAALAVWRRGGVAEV